MRSLGNAGERTGKNGNHQKNKAGRKPVRKNVSETAKVLKMAPVVQKCVFVPLELVAMGGYLLCGTLAFWMRRQWRKVQVTSYHIDERAQAAPHKAS